MFVGHYAAAFAVKKRYPEAPLWQLFVGVQAVDVLFFILVPLGVERLVLRPDEPGLLKLGLEYMPYSHSLVTNLAYGAIVAGALHIAGRPRLGAALGMCVASHWFVDLPVHTPDLPLAAGDGIRVGLGLWKSTVGSFALEIALLAGAWAWLRAALPDRVRRRSDRVVLAMVVVQALTVFVLPAPPSVGQLAIASQAGFLGFAVAGWWMEPQREGPPR